MFVLHNQYCLFKPIKSSKSIYFNHDWHFACFLSWQVFISDSGKKEDIAKANLICQSMGVPSFSQFVFSLGIFFFFRFLIWKKTTKNFCIAFCSNLKKIWNSKPKIIVSDWRSETDLIKKKNLFVTDLICLVILVITKKVKTFQ